MFVKLSYIIVYLLICLFVSIKIVHQLVVLLVATVAAQYYNSEQYPAISSDGQYYYPNAGAAAVEAPVYQPPVHYQPHAHFQPVSPDGQWQTVRDIRQQSPSGEYSYEYETQNGIVASEQSYLAGPNQAQRKTGFYQYPSPDGRTIRVDYVADENGCVFIFLKTKTNIIS